MPVLIFFFLDWSPDQLAQRLYQIVAYLFNQGPVLEDGQTLGISETEQFHIKHEQSQGQALRLLLTLESV